MMKDHQKRVEEVKLTSLRTLTLSTEPSHILEISMRLFNLRIFYLYEGRIAAFINIFLF